jgi:hypothetical protein
MPPGGYRRARRAAGRPPGTPALAESAS